jgi:hypothetical protein
MQPPPTQFFGIGHDPTQTPLLQQPPLHEAPTPQESEHLPRLHA